MKNSVEISVVYGVITLFALLLSAMYGKLIQQKNRWLTCSFLAVAVYDAGYFLLSLSEHIYSIWFAKSLIYMEAVFLPFIMFMIILQVCQVTFHYKYVIIPIMTGGILVFAYGPLHWTYGVYQMLYYVVMISIVWYSMKKRKNIPFRAVTFLLVIVSGDVIIWFLEQVIPVEFEFQVVFYTFTECLLLSFYSIWEEISVWKDTVNQELPVCEDPIPDVPEENIMPPVKEYTEAEDKSENKSEDKSENKEENKEDSCKIPEEDKKQELLDQVKQKISVQILEGLESLSSREIEVLLMILDNKKRKSIAEEMDISENTVKKHTSHIFSKLDVSSRKELFEKCKSNT